MPRLTIFAKANSDVADALFGCAGPSERWEGLNQALRERGDARRVRIRHETFVRSDALLQAGAPPPQDLLGLAAPWPYESASQFSDAFFEAPADAYALSIQADVTTKLVRHRASGRLFYPGLARTIAPDLRAWLKRECLAEPLLTPEESVANFRAIVLRLRSRSRAPVLVFNLSSVAPGEQIGSLRDGAETVSRRIKRFNLAIEDLSALPDVCIVDVDRIVARAGADRLKLDAMRLNVEGSRIVAYEALRLLAAAGVLAEVTAASRADLPLQAHSST